MASITPTSLLTADRELAKSWLLLQKRLRDAFATASQDAGLSNYVYVDGVNGDDGTAIRGSLLFPFLTVQAAIDAAQAGDTILINPGTYTENIVMPATDGLVIQGSGKGNTIIEADVAQPFAFGCQADIQQLEVKDISFRNNSAATAAFLCTYSGGAINDAFLSGELRCVNCDFTNLGAGPSLEYSSLNNFSLEYCTGGTALIHEVSQGLISGCRMVALSTEYDPINEAPAPVQGILEIVVEGSIFSSGIKFGDATSDVNLGKLRVQKDVVTTGLEAKCTDSLGYSEAGHIVFRGFCIGNATMIADLSDAGADHYTFDMDWCRITGALAFSELGGGETSICTARNAVLEGTVDSGNATQLDIRNASFVQANLSSSGGAPGTIDRSVHLETVAPGGAPVVFAVPYSSANYNVHYEISVVGDGPVITAPASKTPAGFQCVAAGANAPVDATVIMNNP